MSAFISPRFDVGQTVYQHEPMVDAMFRGTVVGIQATSADATQWSGTWTLMYEVQFGGEHGSDWVPESSLVAAPDGYHWPPVPEATPAPQDPEAASNAG